MKGNFVNLSEVVESLCRAAPSVTALESQGVPHCDAIKMAESYCPPVRALPRPAVASLGVLGQLLAQYECGDLEIGMVRFYSDPVIRDRVWLVGQVETDALVVDTETGEVRVEEEGSGGRILWRCAMDGDCFVASLVVAADYFGQVGAKPELWKDAALCRRTVSRCAEVAGGSQYGGFFQMLLGADK